MSFGFEAALKEVALSMTWEEASVTLTSTPLQPIEYRYRALFFTRQLAPTASALVELLQTALAVETSLLMRHEIAYVLGQSEAPSAIPLLQEILHDAGEDEVTRHEAAEALAALDAHGVVAELQRYASSQEYPLLADTCELAVEGMKRKGEVVLCACQEYEKVGTERGIEYLSKDPATGREGAKLSDIPGLEKELVDPTLSLYERYEAMFTLRNLGDEATMSLVRGIEAETSGPCLRHEIAFVLGQMEDEKTANALKDRLSDPHEHHVVRHEAAIALSSMGGSKVAKQVLEQHLSDPEPMIHESCAASLATMAYWQAWEDEEARICGS